MSSLENDVYNLQQSLLKLRQFRLEDAGEFRGVYDAIDQLEIDLGRVMLKVHSLMEVCIDKGLVSNEELWRKSHEIDARDGEVNGQLPVSEFRTQEERSRSQSRRRSLHQLERTELASTSDFLADLERQADAPLDSADYLANLERGHRDEPEA